MPFIWILAFFNGVWFIGGGGDGGVGDRGGGGCAGTDGGGNSKGSGSNGFGNTGGRGTVINVGRSNRSVKVIFIGNTDVATNLLTY